MLEKKIFIQGMNGDMEDRLVEPGEYRYALNVRAGVSDGENSGVIENVKGNFEIPITLPSGDNTCIGSLEDKLYKKVYYFLYNTTDKHSILEYDYETLSIREVLQATELNFSLQHYITGVNLVEGELLYWTDDFNEPRSLNVNRDYTSILSSGVDINEIIRSIKTCPQGVITAEYTEGLRNIPFNNVFGKQFQFRYSYTYLDNEQSAWSPISKTPFNQNEERIHLGESDITDSNKAIKLEIPAGNKLIKRINIAVREGNLGKFSQIASLDEDDVNVSGVNYGITSGGIVIYYFYNDEVRIGIDENDSNKLYDAVPKLAKAQELIDGNRLTYGNIQEGFDLIDTDMSAEVDYLGTPNDLDFPVLTKPLSIVYADDGVTAGDVLGFIAGAGSALALGGLSPFPLARYVLDINDNIPSSTFASLSNRAMEYSYFGGEVGPLFVSGELADPFEGDIISITISILTIDNTQSITHTHSYTVLQGDTRIDVIDALLLMINNDIIWDISTKDNSRNFRVITAEPVPDGTDTKILITTNLDASNLPIPIPPGDVANLDYQWQMFVPRSTGTHIRNVDAIVKLIFKPGAVHPIGVVYADVAGRLSTVMGKLDVGVLPQSQAPPGLEGTNAIDLTINHLPPSWAKTCHIVYPKNTTMDRVIQVVIKGISTTPEGRALLDISPTISDYPEATGSITTYDYVKGDRARFIRNPDESFIKEYVDVDVQELTDLNEISISNVKAGFAIEKGMLIEIYTPANVAEEDQFLYYEIGESFPVVNGFHTSNSQDQTATQPAIVRLENQGDTYWRRRNLNINRSGSLLDNYNTNVEDPNFSDFRVSENYHLGRPNIFTKDAQEIRRPTTIYYSNPFIPDTNINGLSSFYLESFEEYDKNYGSIQKLYSEDKRLICFQELKVGQILVNEIIYRDLSGGFSVGASKSILSTMVYYGGEFGISTNPESFAVYGNRKYFTDVNRAAVLRLSTDGITPISDNRQRNFFNDQFGNNITSIWSPVTGVYDKKFDEYVISTREVNISTLAEQNVTNVSTNVNGGVFQIRIIIDRGIEETIRNSEGDLYIQDIGSREWILVDSYVYEESSASVIIDLTSETPLLLDRTEEDLLGGNPIFNFNISTRRLDFIGNTLSFSEPLKKWVSFFSFNPDTMQSAGINIVSWKNGKLYKHNSDNVPYNNFYGVQYNSQIKVIANENPSNIKFYKTMQQESTTPWQMPEGTNQYNQRTNLINEDFETIEGHHYAAFLRDENTPNIADPLIEGDIMRSYTMSLLLTNDSIELEKLFSVGIKYEASELSNR